MNLIVFKETEPFEVTIRRFRKMVEKSGILSEVRSRMFYEKPTSRRKRKRKESVKRLKQRIRALEN